jgi:serine protease inhibitor
MHRVLAKLIPITLLIPILVGAPGARGAPAQSLVEGNIAFALDLYGQLKTRPGNLFFSPYSISTALAMTYAGARGDTEKQMGRVLHFDQDQRQIQASFAELQGQLNEAGQQKQIELNIANALWAQKGHPFLPAFLNVARNSYQANVNQADFVTEAEGARARINRWVAQQTKHRINDILPPGSLTDLTRLVLANAIYFKGSWAKPYNRKQTQSEPFHLSAARQVNVPLMHHFDEVRYTENGDFQAVEFPYQGGQLSMAVLLPREVDGCGSLEDRLTPALLSRSLGQMRQQRVEIFLPRFKVESAFDLNGTLTRMGMPDAFGPAADFSGIDGTRLLFLSGVFHKAWGEVNEEGAEAAAATTVVVGARAVMKPPQPPPIFRADHPFLFLIRDTRSGSVLFLGRLADPSH